LLERALLADQDLARAAVAHELGPLLGAPRGGEELVRTLEVYVAVGQNVRRAARDLGVAPRTVAYRLTRIAELLGGRLEGARLLRLASALELRRLLGPGPVSAAIRKQAGRLPPRLRDRSRRRRCGGQGTSPG
jgi:DNA-binding PucR family transcriptional regulator